MIFVSHYCLKNKLYYRIYNITVPYLPHQERAPCQRAFGPILKPLCLDTTTSQQYINNRSVTNAMALPICHALF